MLGVEKEQMMSRKEYLKQKKKNNNIFLKFLKPAIYLLVVAGLCVYLAKQLHTYNTVTEIANKVIEENNLLKTYKIYFMSKPYTKGSTDNILYYYTGVDEARVEIKEGLGMSKIQYSNGYIYGIQNNLFVRLNVNTNEVDTLDENVVDYVLANSKIYIIKDSGEKSGVYEYILDSNEEEKNKEIIISDVYQMLVDENNIFIVTPGNTDRSIVSYALDGSSKTILTNTEIVGNIIQDKDYIYYSNKSDKNKVYRVSKSGGESVNISSASIMLDNSHINGNNVCCVYNNSAIYINSEDSNIYVYNGEEEKILVENATKLICLKDNMLYFALKNNIEIYRLNLTNNQVDKITSARADEIVFAEN